MLQPQAIHALEVLPAKAHTPSMTPRLRVPSINDTKAAVPWHTNPLSRLQHPKAQLGSTQNPLPFPKRSESPSFPNALRTITANTYYWHKPHETTPPKSRTRHPNQTLQISNENNRPHNPPTTSPFPKISVPAHAPANLSKSRLFQQLGACTVGRYIGYGSTPFFKTTPSHPPSSAQKSTSRSRSNASHSFPSPLHVHLRARFPSIVKKVEKSKRSGL